MTYCVAIAVNAGIIFCSDSRTNAGVDQISTYSKMSRFGNDGERQFIVLSAGNLATTQAVINQIKNDINQKANRNLLNIPSLHKAAEYLGEVSVAQQEKHGKGPIHEASFIIGGQIAGAPHQIMMVYPQGNFITSSVDTPYLQIGESKYGKPILDRIIEPNIELNTAALCALVSMDSTMRSNLTVGPPIEVTVYESNTQLLNHRYRLEQNSDYLHNLNRAWDDGLKAAFSSLPPIQWADISHRDQANDEFQNQPNN
ncbi:MAG: peptidase [Pseudomonadales bacterium]|nr:peptidase [Pseudomonadales bacterium]